jgi:hypothetical protein
MALLPVFYFARAVCSHEPMTGPAQVSCAGRVLASRLVHVRDRRGRSSRSGHATLECEGLFDLTSKEGDSRIG